MVFEFNFLMDMKKTTPGFFFSLIFIYLRMDLYLLSNRGVSA